MGVSAVLAAAVVVLGVSGERLWEQGRPHRVHDHHERFDDPVYDGGDEGLEDEHRGIPMVEDDVPEWVKLTFADKFIALGETEFLALYESNGDDEDAVDRPADVDLRDQDDYAMEDDDDEEGGHRLAKRHDEASDGSDAYEYFYSDDEQFEFDPARDQLVDEAPRRRGVGRSRVMHGKRVHELDLEEMADPPEYQDGGDEDDEDLAMARAVREHRDALATHAPVASIPANTNKPTWQDKINQGVGDAARTSLLETESFTRQGPPSHLPGSRRRARRAQGREHMDPTAISPRADPTDGPRRYSLGQRYTDAERPVRLNEADPRLANRQVVGAMDGRTVFLEEAAVLSSPDDLPLSQGSARRARSHRAWLNAAEKQSKTNRAPGDDVELPRLQKHMYSNGLPVADWEVGYVDNVLKQFGYGPARVVA